MLLLLVAALAACADAASGYLPLPLLPILHWPAFSDWLDVKTVCGAKGDGVTDDTKAVQCGMNAYHVNNNFTVCEWTPPGGQC